jgi:hypothetical protein
LRENKNKTFNFRNQSFFSNHQSSSLGVGYCSMSRERENIIKELISTEEKYLSDLNVMINVYKIPLEKSKLLPDMDIKTIFKNIPILMNVSAQLHKQVLEYYGNHFLFL